MHSFDFDTSIERRGNEPEFYGAIPDGRGGSIVFVCMILNSALLLLVRSSSTALLMTMDKKYALYYAVGDQAVFFFQRWMRNDIHSFFNVDGWVGVVFGDFVSQFMFKITTDYTGLAQLRGPAALGGCWWSFSMVNARSKRALPSPTNTNTPFFESTLARSSSPWASPSSLPNCTT